MPDSELLGAHAGIGSNDADALGAAERDYPCFSGRSTIAGPPGPDPFDELELDASGKMIPNDAQRAALKERGFEIVVGNGNGMFGVRKA